MKKFKGTPGPWVVVDNDVYFDIRKGWKSIGDVCASMHAFDDSNHRGVVATANANLIAAAPELLEALQLMLNDECSDTHNHAVNTAEKAIAKALGEQP